MCEEKLEPEQEERGGEGSRKGEGRGFICALGYWLTRRHYTTSWTLPYVFTPAAAPYTTHLQPVTATRLGIHCHQHHITPHLLSAHAPRTRTERETDRERERKIERERERERERDEEEEVVRASSGHCGMVRVIALDAPPYHQLSLPAFGSGIPI